MVAFIFYQCDKWLQIWMKFQNLELSMAFKKYKWGLWKILSTINHAHKQCLYTSFFGSSSIERSGFELLWFQIWRWARKNSKFTWFPPPNHMYFLLQYDIVIFIMFSTTMITYVSFLYWQWWGILNVLRCRKKFYDYSEMNGKC